MSDAATLEQEVPGGTTVPEAQGNATPPPAAPPTQNGGTPQSEAPHAASNLLSDGAAPPAEPPADQPVDDWRVRMADGDEAFLKQLRRYASEKNFGKAHKDAIKELRTKRAGVSLPDNASEEEVAEYRKAAGIPETPDGYQITLPNAEQASDADKEVLSAILETAHKTNTPPANLKAIADIYFAKQQEFAARQAEEAKRSAAETIRTLRSEWSREWDLNMRVMDDTLDQYTGNRGGELASLRLANGQPLATHELFARFVVNAGRELAPAAVLEYGGSGSGGKPIEEQIEEGLAVMNTDPNKYFSDAHQKKMAALYEAQEKLRSRGQAA